jgi:DNA-binding NarL/FixJ family response regulator
MKHDSMPGKDDRSVGAPPAKQSKEAELPEASASQQAPIAEPVNRIRVLLADDHVLVRHGIMILLNEEPDIEVIATANNGEEAVELARLHRPDVILMDMSMPKLSGIEATRIVCRETPGVCIIGLSMFDDVETTQAMLAAGASSYVIKSGPPGDLISAIRRGLLASNRFK